MASSRHRSRSVSPVRHKGSASNHYRDSSVLRSPRDRSSSPRKRRSSQSPTRDRRRKRSPAHSRRRSSSSPRRKYRSPSPRHRSRDSISPDKRNQSSRSRHSISRSRSPSSRWDKPQKHSGRSPPHPRSDRNNRSRDQHKRGGYNQRNPRQGGNRNYEWGGDAPVEEEEEVVEPKIEPNFGLSGKLAAETNTVNGVELKYNEPADSVKPKESWRFYVFKGDKQIDLLHIHRQSCYLIGRDRAVSDIPVDHPSCSKQHAVLQYRLVEGTDENGKTMKLRKPFIIDLEATNGTYLNGDKIPSRRYVELRPKDILKFGNSTREFVLLRPE
ncbi:SMAD/FHA domain-containing protein [Pilobolus umbonatus]|nr:SMAD/FHA domain-containing protein [Pilobolus umbonatus]